MAPYFIGIDVGTQGVRTVLIDTVGSVISSASQVFPLSETSRQEQSPVDWWQACYNSLLQLMLEAKNINVTRILAVAVTSTSGTVIPLDIHNRPLHNAIMYSDNRSGDQAARCTEMAIKYHNKGYTAFNSSSGLAKMIWYQETFPKKMPHIAKWVHAADFITGMLCNDFGITDYTNALKSGFDVSTFEWPEYIFTKFGLLKEWMPQVVPSGTVIGKISHQVALQLGLPQALAVTAGITDGCASQIASGTINPGDWNTTIGTTMVIKGVTMNELDDPLGRLYNHRHPEGYWMPGGASNTGADWITNEFAADLDDLNIQAQKLLPTNYIAYPLQQKGERFPLISPEAQGFEPSGLTKSELFTANMEGVGYLEKYAYDLIEYLSGEKVNAVYTAGGGSNSDAWLTIRSNILNKPVYKMKHISGSVGAAILAASKTYFHSIMEAAKAMTVLEKEVHPDGKILEVYKVNYQHFLHIMKQKGYIKGGFNA